MNKVIRGKRYDTETAEFIDSWSYAYPRDFDYVREVLYRKRGGEFFVHGEGGARSKYSRQVEQNCWSGGEEIRPLTDEEAREWVEEHCDADTYEKLFTLDDTEESVRVMLTAAEKDKLAKYARSVNRTMSEVIRRYIATL